MNRALGLTSISLLFIAGVFFGDVSDACAEDEKVKISVVVLHDSKTPEGLPVAIERGFLLEMKSHKHMQVDSLGSLMAKFAKDDGGSLLEAAKKTLKNMEAHIGVPRGVWFRIKRLKKAVKSLEKNLAYESKKKLARGQFLLARALMTAREWRAARRILVRLLVWRPGYKIASGECRRRCRREVRQARKQAKGRSKKEVEVVSAPTGAKVYLDGKYKGVTPVTMRTAQGRHYLTLRTPGYLKKVLPLVVKGRGPVRRVVILERSSEALILKQTLASIKKTIGRRKASTAIRQLRHFLLLDQVVLVGIKTSGKVSVVNCYLYDLRTRLLLSRLTKRVTSGSQPEVSRWSQMLFQEARLDGTLPDPGPEPISRGRGALYQKWWFWTALAVGAASLAIPLGWGLAQRGSGSRTVPKGFAPVSIGF